MYFILKFSVHAIGAGFPRGWMYDKGWIQTKTPRAFLQGLSLLPALAGRAGLAHSSGGASSGPGACTTGMRLQEQPCSALGLRKGH